MINYGEANFKTTFLQTDRVQDINLSQIKLKVNVTYKKDETITTKFEPSNIEVVMNKAHLDTELSNIEGHLSIKKKDYNEHKLHDDKQSEGVFIEKAVKTTIQIFYDKGLFDNYENAEEILKIVYLLKLTKDVDPI